MKASNESLERMRSFTSRWNVWYEGKKSLFVNEGCEVLVIGFPEEREAMTTVVSVVEQHSLFEGIDSITCKEGSGHHFAGYFP
jgi:hypothetical protein